LLSDPQLLRIALTWVVAWEIDPSQSRKTFSRQLCSARVIVADKLEQNSEILVVNRIDGFAISTGSFTQTSRTPRRKS
jgi:hypothetical protein